MENRRYEQTGKISVVIPVYGSRESLEMLVTRLMRVLGNMDCPYELILVDDCSPDDSWEVLKRLKDRHGKRLKIARLLVNSGQHNAILCGLSLADGDMVVTMDDDLQNPPEEIPRLIRALEEGYDLAIGAYDAKRHSALRNFNGGMIDRIQRHIFNLPGNFQLTSFRAAKRSVVDNVNRMSGAYPYITSMFLANAAMSCNVPVKHEKRKFGTSNYNFKKNVTLAANLLFSYSSYPLMFVGLLCLAAFLFSAGLGCWTFWQVLRYGVSVPGWASIVVILSFFNALILLGMVVFGVYLMRLYQQTTRLRANYKIGEIHG